MRSLNFVGWIGLALAVPTSGLVGCAGRGSSQNPPGQSKAAMTKVSPSSVTAGSVPACAAGTAHRNVCCSAGPSSAASCGVYVDDSFHSCDSGWTTYPDPTACCDLNDPATCEPPPPPPPIDAGSPNPTCGYTCPPGWYASGDACCSVDANGVGVCYATAYGGSSGTVGSVGVNHGGPSTSPSGPPVAIDAGAACDPKSDPSCTVAPPPPPLPDDAGTCDPMKDPNCGCVVSNPSGPPLPITGGSVCPGPVPVPPPPSPPPPPPCDLTCPDGWQQPSGDPDLCCRTDAAGTIECFSQAVGPAGAPSPSTPPTAGASGGSVGANGSGGTTGTK